jgi:hypothetical protein
MQAIAAPIIPNIYAISMVAVGDFLFRKLYSPIKDIIQSKGNVKPNKRLSVSGRKENASDLMYRKI